MKALPAALAEIPANQRAARTSIISAVTALSEAVSQALNIVTLRCGELILIKHDLRRFRSGLVASPSFLDGFRLHGVCDGLAAARADLRTVLSMRRLSLRLFTTSQLQSLLDEIQYKERDLEEDFDKFFRDVSRRGATLKREEVAEVVKYLGDCQREFEIDAATIRAATRQLENVV